MYELSDGECVHGMLPGTCAYCSGSWRREQDALARETRSMLARMAGKRDVPVGTITRDGWTTSR